MATQWNDEENYALLGLPLLARVVYWQCFRCYMDYDTGIVGVARRISYQMMAEICEFTPDKGSKQPHYRPTREQLRAAVRQLQRKGLLELKSKPLEPPVYLLLLATTNRASPTSTLENCDDSQEVGGFYSQEEPPRNHQGGTPTGTTSNTPIYIEDYMNPKGTTKEPQGMNPIPQGSVLPNLTLPVQITISDEDSKKIPARPSEWCEFFVNHVRYQFHEVKTVPASTMFRTWCESKLSLFEAVIAIEAAELKLGRRPDKPAYYKLFVEQVIRERNKKQNPQGAHYGKAGKRPTAEELAIEQLGGGRVYEHED